ncbi:hypothetical protein [Wolbachia endosymbiont of Bemisia tabaci]|uniref:hypothetical protein n=1 Tax=Wolbachia endosymbiont of Bemisia tabaci TaxID=215173 RepID=UPI0013DF970B|nr:hypothetical protein [Wolbachia endosymbiont of Bemisia tabaci]
MLNANNKINYETSIKQKVNYETSIKQKDNYETSIKQKEKNTAYPLCLLGYI